MRIWRRSLTGFVVPALVGLFGRWGTDGATFEASAVLDGCGVIGVLRREGRPEEVLLLTFDPKERRWYTVVLRAGEDPEVYSGTSGWVALSGEGYGELQWVVWGKAGTFANAGTNLGLYRKNDRVTLRRLVDQERR